MFHSFFGLLVLGVRLLQTEQYSSFFPPNSPITSKHETLLEKDLTTVRPISQRIAILTSSRWSSDGLWYDISNEIKGLLYQKIFFPVEIAKSGSQIKGVEIEDQFNVCRIIGYVWHFCSIISFDACLPVPHCRIVCGRLWFCCNNHHDNSRIAETTN